MKKSDVPARQNTDSADKQVSSLPLHLLGVLALMSEGMSNGQIASKLGYKNAATVSSLVYEVYKRFGLAGIFSRQEKRQLATEAFKQSNASTIKSDDCT
jgi:DNA-binding NarL/FixJ family response regulator